MMPWVTTSASDLDRIRKQYGPKTQQPAQFKPSPVAGLPPAPAGVAGPTGPSDAGWSPLTVPAIGDDQTTRNAAAFAGSPDDADPAPAANATQRWQAGGGDTRSISPQRRFFWATGLVDAHATQSPRNAPTDFAATFGPDRSHMGGAGTTWQDRQASNAAGVAGVVAQRGLPTDWSPY